MTCFKTLARPARHDPRAITMMSRSHALKLCLPFLLCVSAFQACKDDVKPTAISQEPTRDASENPGAASPIEAPSPEGDGPLFVALGCPSSKVTPTSCKVCPSLGVPSDEESLAEADVTFKVRRAQYSATTQPQALISYDYCGDNSHGALAKQFVHLEQDASGKWAPKSQLRVLTDDASKECIEVAHKGTGLLYLLCESGGGRQGVYPQQLYLVDWSQVEGSDGEPYALPKQSLIFSGGVLDDCSSNFELSALGTPEIKDVNSDGELDIVVQVAIHEGPWAGDRAESECAGDEALSPDRERYKENYELIFEAQPDGSFKEKTGKDINIVAREAYSKYF